MEEPQILPSIGFVEAIKKGFTNFTDFRSRSRRSEYWFFILGIFLVQLVLGLILGVIGFTIDEEDIYEYGIPFVFFCGIIFLLPVAIRRLHDIGKSGWFMLLVCIPIIGEIILIIFFCIDSQMDSNEYGPSPKYFNFGSGNTMIWSLVDIRLCINLVILFK